MEEEGLAVQGSRFTYAVGRLTLWSPGPTMIEGNGKAMLLSDDVEHVAIANPKTAPYGAAAKEVLQALGLWEPIQDQVGPGRKYRTNVPLRFLEECPTGIRRPFAGFGSQGQRGGETMGRADAFACPAPATGGFAPQWST